MSDITACKHDFLNNFGFLSPKSDAQLTFVSNLHKTRSGCPHGGKKSVFWKYKHIHANLKKLLVALMKVVLYEANAGSPQALKIFGFRGNESKRDSVCTEN